MQPRRESHGHTVEDHRRAFTHIKSLLAPLFIVVIDDWNQEQAKGGSREAFLELGWTVVYETELPEKAYEVDPSCAKANEVLASTLGLKMGKIKDERGKLDAVWRLIELCDRAIDADPTLPTPYHLQDPTPARLSLTLLAIHQAFRGRGSFGVPTGL